MTILVTRPGAFSLIFLARAAQQGRITFSNLKDFITRLQASSNPSAQDQLQSRDSLDAIKSNIENLKVFENQQQQPNELVEVAFTRRPAPYIYQGSEDSNSVPTRRPPYMYQIPSAGSDGSTLPSTILASMVADLQNEEHSFRPQESLSFKTTASTTSTTTTFSMPNFFGALLTASPSPDTYEPSTLPTTTTAAPTAMNNTRIHHHYHYYD